MLSDEFALAILGLFLFIAGSLCSWAFQKWRLQSYHELASQILTRAEEEALQLKEKVKEALVQAERSQKEELETARQEQQRRFQQDERRLQAREDKCERKVEQLDKRVSEIEKRESALAQAEHQLELRRAHEQYLVHTLTQKLEQLAGITVDEARAQLLQQLDKELQAEQVKAIRRIEQEVTAQANQLATTVLATAINRLAVPCVSETTVTTVSIPNEEIKGRIIGREGRNIRHLERLTGVNFLMDETPGIVVIAGFDPVRKHIAKLALTELVQDGRIHPTRIEETVEKARLDIERQIRRAGEEAAMRSGALGLHPELLNLLGKLKFRTSYGQNILEHSLEVSHLLGLMAAELGLDISLAKRIGLLHDVGKAVTHEIEGSHAIIGHDFALKYGETAAVANGIGCHHGEMAPLTIEGSLCAAADALSAARPGGRVEAVEECLKRVKHLEQIALEFPGVEQAYALRAGREIHISVTPEAVDDDAMLLLARQVTRRIEEQLTYPGKIKVMVIREKRAIQYAL